jgi:hypothetical protein
MIFLSDLKNEIVYHIAEMKKNLLALIPLLLSCITASGQEQQVQGNAIAEIFTDFHININDTARHTGFALNRAYFGYRFLPGGNFSAQIIINVGSPEDLVTGSTPHRYAFFREASIAWSDKRLTLTMGITNTKLFEFQQKFWGKRYVANTYQSINGYGFVADLGVTAEFKVNKVLQADLILMNGEGYNNLQVDDNLRLSLGLTITPAESLAIRLIGDIQKKDGLWQPMAVGFIGFKNDLITVGGEVSYKSNLDLNKGHHAWGISATGGLNITKKTEIFSRFDYSSSVRVPGDLLQWNYRKDGSLIIAGIQHTFSPNVKIAVDYQGTYPYSSLRQISDLFYINALFKF